MVGYPKMAICDGENGWKWWSTPIFLGYLMFGQTHVLTEHGTYFRCTQTTLTGWWLFVTQSIVMQTSGSQSGLGWSCYIYIYTQYIYTQYIYSIYTRLYSIYTLSIISKKPLRGDQSHDEKSSSYTPLPLSVITNCLFVVCVYIYIYISCDVYIYTLTS